MGCQNMEGHIFIKEPLCPAVGFFCTLRVRECVQAALRGCQMVLGPHNFHTGLDGHRDPWQSAHLQLRELYCICDFHS